MRPVAPNPELLTWLWSDEGLEWASKFFKRVRHAFGSFAEIKDDHECGHGSHCEPHNTGPYPNAAIIRDIDKYGISGVPEEWKQR